MNFRSETTETAMRRWMLVDDNAEILNILSALLPYFTDAVLECHTSPVAALAAYTEAPGGYELVITDFEMPEMDGVELCRSLHSVSPLQKVFLATGSGYFSPAAARHFGFSALLNKPFPLVALSDALDRAGLNHKGACCH